jgi:hypothetical protein
VQLDRDQVDQETAAAPDAAVTSVHVSPLSTWTGLGSYDADVQEQVESGAVLHCPELAFDILPEERALFDPNLSDPKRKSIYLRGMHDAVFGTSASAEKRRQLQALLQRYRDSAMALATGLFPSYRGVMRAASTSFRPRPTGVGRKSLSWRKDDTRLHVDAFPSNPTHGVRILRVFTNVGSTPRVWRVGQPFTAMALRFLPQVPQYSAWRARLLARLGITKRRRTAYDHIMLHLHDGAKDDLDYQRTSPQLQVEFMPGSSWICFSDQVMHAVMGGQYMMEQTIHVPLDALEHPAQSPLAVLERLTASELLAEPGPPPFY